MLLLDVNVLLALAWPNHQFHAAATERMEDCEEPWATCALTQLGFIRVSSNPGVFSPRRTPAEAARLLAEMLEDSRHVYLEKLPPAGFIAWNPVGGHQAVTDAYLLGLAAASQAVLLTFDLRLNALAAKGSLELLKM